MPCDAQMSMTRSRCLKPDSLRTRGFISSVTNVQHIALYCFENRLTLEVVIVEGESDAIQSEALEELSVGIGKEVLQELKGRDVKMMALIE
jgi:hypothetical protein